MRGTGVACQKELFTNKHRPGRAVTCHSSDSDCAAVGSCVAIEATLAKCELGSCEFRGFEVFVADSVVGVGSRIISVMAEVGGSQAFVYRISPEDEWAAAQTAGKLRGGQLDTTSGYIHLSTAAQVAGTLALFYAGRSDLYLLKVNASKLGDGLRYDEVEGVSLFPHFYGPDGTFTPLPLSAVEASAKIELEKGQHVLPFDLTNN